jgi:GTP-binding protein
MDLGQGRSIVIADIPGIIEGAHAGKGLGLKFLQHVERTRMLAFLVPVDAPDPQMVLDQLRTEIREYSASLFDRPFVVLLTKRDLLPADAPLPALDAPEARWVMPVSAASGAGIGELREKLWDVSHELRAES